MSPVVLQLSESFFSIPLSTYRDRNNGPLSIFPYEMLISAISIYFFRTTIYQRGEPRILRWFFGGMLAFLAYFHKSYELISAVEIFSYIVPYILFSTTAIGTNLQQSTTTTTTPNVSLIQQQSNSTTAIKIVYIAISAILSLLICHLTSTGLLYKMLNFIIPQFIKDILVMLFPIQEVYAAYDILNEFVYEKGLLGQQITRLFFITFHIQIGIGYIGIDFLKREQERRNQLIKMDIGIGSDDDDDDDDDDDVSNNNNNHGNGTTSSTTTSSNSSTKNNTARKDSQNTKQKLQRQSKIEKQSKQFQRTAAPFIFLTAVPYMIKVIGYGNLNAFAFQCFKDDIHRTIRLYDLFDHDNNLVAISEHSAKSPADFAGYMDTIVTTTYDIFNRKLFSLPKVLLLPMVMSKQPKMIAQIFPIIFFSDWLKGRAVSYMTHRIESLEKDIQELNAIRSKVEQFDMKNAELLQRAGPDATNFTSRRWQELTVKVQMKSVVSSLTSRTKGFFAFIQRNFVFSVLVDCALAQLMAAGKLLSADIFVFSRAIEDAVDMVLMRSRSEAELARMLTQIDNLKELSEVWNQAEKRNFLPCNVAPPDVTAHAADKHTSLVVIRNLVYSRGTALVRIDHMELPAGIYALTGANGSGKSTLFRLLMSCKTNDRPIDLPPSIVLSTPMEPLIEKDDIQREISCEAADELEEEQEEEYTTTRSTMADSSDSESSASPSQTFAEKIEQVHPRLSITMPSSHVVEISQTFYWPLYSKPIDWIYQEHVSETCTDSELTERARRVAELLHALEFSQSIETDEEEHAENEDNSNNVDGDSATTRSLSSSTEDSATEDIVVSSPTGDIIAKIIDELLEEKEDWFNDLSGGQKSKVELVRKVFLLEDCPHILLVDETMAPLDPKSKALVMAQIKSFCAGSVVIVIYHTDVGRGQESSDSASDEDSEFIECVPSNAFFDGNIHVENKMMHLRPVC